MLISHHACIYTLSASLQLLTQLLTPPANQRHPHTARVLNVTQDEGDDKDVVVEETEEHLEAKIADLADLHAKVK